MSNNKERYVLFGILVVVLILAFYIIFNLMLKNTNKNSINKNQFQTLTSNQNNVEFQVIPLSTSEFQIAVNTHSIDLNFDLTEISNLYDDIGNVYKPLKWEGSAPGGHHRSGVLKFALINKNAKSIKLVITDSTEREFSWNIK